MRHSSSNEGNVGARFAEASTILCFKCRQPSTLGTSEKVFSPCGRRRGVSWTTSSAASSRAVAASRCAAGLSVELCRECGRPSPRPLSRPRANTGDASIRRLRRPLECDRHHILPVLSAGRKDCVAHIDAVVGVGGISYVPRILPL
jgi:hypothetical protein